MRTVILNSDRPKDTPVGNILISTLKSLINIQIRY